MKVYKLFSALVIVVVFFSCNGSRKDGNQQSSIRDTIHAAPNKEVYDDNRESLKLSVADTIKRSASYFFSNRETKDQFVLKIAPGMVKSSKAELQIVTADGKVIYSQAFDAFFFVRGIYEPDTIPTTGGQSDYEAYMERYWKSITQQQFEVYFKRSVDSFFTNIYPIEHHAAEDINAWNGEIENKAFWDEILKDPAIKLMDITCFDCSEGGVVIGYSRKEGKVVKLLEHD